ncbi:coiled-coil domain-containing protein 103 [Leptopilina heterotoma]|uniref:coiled-coil domain-containing protein 103 n=1 Tax=Leptopilina heterotoma TaxID=63436 RepID=UPI001CA836B4|nr:coiled-coil domain-containing protein 103 [Leptopilina heterotoma]
MSILEEKIDYKCLEEELHQAIKDDELYQLQNDAKFRAIEQKVPTYKDFREMVNAAHLQPLANSDQKNRTSISKNIFANRSEDWDLVSKAQNVKLTAPLFESDETLSKIVPKDTKEFLTIWKKITNSELKFNYLLDSRDQLGKKIFISEIPCEFFEEVIIISSKQLSSYKIENIIDLFIKLSKCNRFELNLIFLPEDKRTILRKLLQDLLLTEIKDSQQLTGKYKTILN